MLLKLICLGLIAQNLGWELLLHKRVSRKNWYLLSTSLFGDLLPGMDSQRLQDSSRLLPHWFPDGVHRHHHITKIHFVKTVGGYPDIEYPEYHP